MDLVPDRRVPGDGRQQRVRQSQPVDRAALHRPLQAQEFARGVVAEHHPVLAVEQDEPLPDGVQGGLVVLVEVAELGRPHAVGVPPQPGVGEVGADPADGQRGPRDPHQGEQRTAQPGRDRLHRDARADQRHHPVPLVQHRGDHPHRRAERAGVGLAAGLPRERPVDVPEEGPPDLLGQRVGPADAGGVHHGDEGDPGVDPHPLGVGLEHRRRIGRPGGVKDGRRVGDGAGDGGDLAAGRVVGAPGGEQVREHRPARDHGGDDHHLDEEELSGQAAHQPARRERGTRGHACQCAPRPRRRGPRCGDENDVNSMNANVTPVTPGRHSRSGPPPGAPGPHTGAPP